MGTARLARLAAASLAAVLPALATAVQLNVSGEARQEINTPQFQDRYQSLASYLGASLGTDVRLAIGRDLSRELQKMRAGLYEVLVGPAHVIGAAMRYGYEPVARFAGEERAVFVASEASGIKTFEAAKGARLALPPTDSLATYLARGELNAIGMPTREYFKDIREFRYHEAALLALELGLADVAVADRRLAEEWLARNKGRILLETKGAPMTGVAVLSSLDRTVKDRIKAAFLAPNAKTIASVDFAGLDVRGMQPITVKEYDYVSTLGYFTPRVLDGVKIVSAEEVAALMKKGVPMFDTRSEEEYRDKHIKGAKWLPYGEKSTKEVGFEAKRDQFDLSGIADKGTPVIFACNGAECWKSYKSSVTARAQGFTQVYWFRGGFPEWVAKGYPIESVATNVVLTR
jgi:ABC-type phosphate/phosphonate transport system substrate-binding protein/rhodanese-related sulfurtransferase